MSEIWIPFRKIRDLNSQMWLSRCEWPTAKRERQLWSCTGPWVTLVMSRIGTGPKICSTDKVAMSTNKNICFYLFLIFFEWKNDHPDWPTSAPSWDHPRISLILGTSVTSCTMVVTPLPVSSSPVISPPTTNATTNAPRLRPRTWLSSSEKCSSRDLRRNGNGSFACWGHRDDDQPWTFQDLVVQSADRICSNTRPERYVTWWAKKGGYLVWSIN